MRQDESGRWVSDDGRYLWNGAEWLDLQSDPATSTPGGPAPDGPTPDGPTPEAAVPENGSVPAGRSPGPARHGTSAGHRRRGRPLALLSLLLVVVLLGVGAVLLFGDEPASPPSASPTPVAPGEPTPGTEVSPSASSAVLDEPQRRARAEGALLRRSDIPGATEERTVNPTDVFLPCRAPALVPPEGSVLVGRTISTTDFTTYVGQTVVGYPTARAAADALAALRSGVGSCEPYDYRYVNSSRVDRITHTDIDPAFPLGDAGVYLVEVDTPANYAGSPTSYSYGYVQQGQFLVRMTITNASRADRPGLELLLRRTLDALR